MDQHARFAAIREQGEGQAAIFMEFPKAHSVRVSGVTTDDWGVESEITCISAPGFELFGNHRKPCQLSCAWIAWWAEPEEWGAQQVSWQLYFAPGFVEAVGAKAARCDREGRPLGYPDAMECLGRYRMKERGETGDEVAGLG